MLSSATDATTQSSLGHHPRSETLAVCPPCTNMSSGGPSTASSGPWWSPMRDRSHVRMRRSAPHDASTVSFLGDHPIWKTSSAWCSRTCSRWLRLRQS
eukprot:366237-Chlamydomonas_euryale.AAC.4